MLTIPFLLLFAITPAIFWFYGKRFLGSQTHPAALFILTCIASYILLVMANCTRETGEFSLLWVIVNFGVLAIAGKIMRKPEADSAAKEVENKK